MSGYLIKP